MSLAAFLATARRGAAFLGDASPLVDRFLRSQLLPEGGGRNREGAPDLYYTVFVLQGLTALGSPYPAATVANHLRGYGSGSGLDLVHLASLIRCWALLRLQPPAAKVRRDGAAETLPPLDTATLHAHLNEFRTTAGGFGLRPRAPQGTLYGLYLAVGAHLDLGLPLDRSVIGLLRAWERPGSGWANEEGIGAAPLTVTAAAVSILNDLGEPIPASASAWLLRHWHPQGGFRASLETPLPDLLSTATGLYALRQGGADLSGLREPCLDFIDSLWTNTGGFHGHWADDPLDGEYTFYGLLALGCLAPEQEAEDGARSRVDTRAGESTLPSRLT